MGSEAVQRAAVPLSSPRVTPGVSVTVLQVFPGIVFLCDQTELVVERGVAAAIHVGREDHRAR